MEQIEQKPRQPILLEDFMRSALDATNNGTKDQQAEIAVVIAWLSSHSRELKDQINGVRQEKDHPHHDKKGLQEAVCDGIKLVNKIISEMGFSPLQNPDLKEYEIDK